MLPSLNILCETFEPIQELDFEGTMNAIEYVPAIQGGFENQWRHLRDSRHRSFLHRPTVLTSTSIEDGPLPGGDPHVAPKEKGSKPRSPAADAQNRFQLFVRTLPGKRAKP